MGCPILQRAHLSESTLQVSAALLFRRFRTCSTPATNTSHGKPRFSQRKRDRNELVAPGDMSFPPTRRSLLSCSPNTARSCWPMPTAPEKPQTTRSLTLYTRFALVLTVCGPWPKRRSHATPTQFLPRMATIAPPTTAGSEAAETARAEGGDAANRKKSSHLRVCRAARAPGRRRGRKGAWWRGISAEKGHQKSMILEALDASYAEIGIGSSDILLL
eukprot:scaffold7624_cov248-Pinguiococcus_pyrenoidosus.AAC.22